MTIRHVRIIDLVTPIAAPPWPDVIERDDGKFQLGTADDSPGPFETREFAAAVAREMAKAA
jgi:hypothetical protein